MTAIICHFLLLLHHARVQLAEWWNRMWHQ